MRLMRIATGTLAVLAGAVLITEGATTMSAPAVADAPPNVVRLGDNGHLLRAPATITGTGPIDVGYHAGGVQSVWSNVELPWASDILYYPGITATLRVTTRSTRSSAWVKVTIGSTTCSSSGPKAEVVCTAVL